MFFSFPFDLPGVCVFACVCLRVRVPLYSLVLIAEHGPGDTDTDAEGGQQQTADLRPLVQVGQVVFRDPATITTVNTLKGRPQTTHRVTWVRCMCDKW